MIRAAAARERDGAPVIHDAAAGRAELYERIAAETAGENDGGRVEAEVLRHAEGERALLEYRFEDGLHLYAKRYAQSDSAMAAHGHAVLRALWQGGFGSGSLHRVAEPLAFFPERGVLILRAAPGDSVSALRARGWADWERGLRGAAAWLARLHASPLPFGPAEETAAGVFRMARRVAKAAARRPELEAQLVGLIEELAGRGSGGSGRRVPTHGRYHSGHVFLAPGSVTVIDPDRAALADPAKDVGEFLHRLRKEAMEAGLDEGTAERATRAFLSEYAAHAPAPLDGLLYHWSYSVLSTLLHAIRKDRSDRDGWERRLAFYRAEFGGVPAQVTAFGAAS